MVSSLRRLLLPLMLLVGLGGCVAYSPEYGHGYGGGYGRGHYAPTPVYVAPAVRYSNGGWRGGHYRGHHGHHRRDW